MKESYPIDEDAPRETPRTFGHGPSLGPTAALNVIMSMVVSRLSVPNKTERVLVRSISAGRPNSFCSVHHFD